MRSPLSALAPGLGAVLVLLLAAAPVRAQEGAIAGLVTDQELRPIAGAQISLEGTGYGALSDAEGRYRVQNVRPGTYNVTVQYIGYATSRQANVVVGQGAVATVDFQLRTEALRLQEIVVTGVADPIEGVRMPFSVSRVSMENIPVRPPNMASALQGRVAGARVVSSSGQPGTGVDIRLRARAGINTSDEPLLVVDGVIQAQDLIDLDALDIESIEVLKGAAAASLYGSRAQAGVVEITTRRGREVASGQTRITLRSEYGRSFLTRIPQTATHHPFLVNDAGQWIDADGNPVDRINRVIKPDRMIDVPYQGPLYNHLDLFFDPGRFVNNTLTIAQNTQSTNFFASFADNREGGVAPQFNDGYHRQNLRFNMDHRIRSDLTVGVTTYYSTSARQNLEGGNPFYNLRFVAPDIDLSQPNPDGSPWIIKPDPTQLQNSPLYALWANDSRDYRQRFQGSLQGRYNPFSWLNLDGLFAYDRSDRERHRVRPQGFLTDDDDVTLDGIVDRLHNFSEGLNGHVQATLIRSFGDLTARTRFRYNFEREDNSGFGARGQGFVVNEVPTLNNMLETQACQPQSGSPAPCATSGQPFAQVRQLGYMANTGLDFQGKYIGDFLIRRDGSSLFGPDNRWHTYYRASFSYLMSEELWWPFRSITAFKPRYSIGTAGARPGYAWQYETWSVTSAGPSKGSLGNKSLAPEVTTEQDFGLDMIINDRFSVELTYARSRVDNQLLQVPLPGFYGYSSQWQNAGQVTTRAYEATFEAALFQRPDLGWNMGLVVDRARSWISDWNRTCYRQSNFYYCNGESLSSMRRRTWMTGHDHLPDFHAGSRDKFQVNDDGYLVPVGDHNWTDGLAQNLWGTRVTIDGREYAWGVPIFILNDQGLVDDLHVAGDANPRFNLGWTNRVRWRGLNAFVLVDAKVGGDVYNGTRQWPYRDNMHMDQVQAGKPAERKKPLDYYQTLYSTNSNNSHFIEDGSFVKFRELSLAYQLRRDQLERFLPIGGMGLQSVSFNLIGRNLFTITRYSEIDPEVGSSSGSLSAVDNPVDDFTYPNFRQFTFSVEIQF